MKLMIKVDDKGIISDVKFKTFGCGSAIASSSYMTERVRGLSLDEAAAIKNTEIAQEVRRRACSRESRLAEEVTDPANPPFVSPYTSHDLLPPTCYLFLYLFLDNKSALLATRQAALLHARVRPPPVAPRDLLPLLLTLPLPHSEDAIKAAIKDYRKKATQSNGKVTPGHIDVSQSAATGHTTAEARPGQTV